MDEEYEKEEAPLAHGPRGFRPSVCMEAALVLAVGAYIGRTTRPLKVLRLGGEVVKGRYRARACNCDANYTDVASPRHYFTPDAATRSMIGG